jgi:hypothetical protein
MSLADYLAPDQHQILQEVAALLPDMTPDERVDVLLSIGLQAMQQFQAEVLRIVREQPFYPDTDVGKRQQWVKDEIARKVEALVGEGGGVKP